MHRCMDVCTDRISPHSTGLCPLLGPLPKKGPTRGSEGLPEWSEGLPNGSEGLPERPEGRGGLSEGPEGCQRGLRACLRGLRTCQKGVGPIRGMGGWTYGWMDRNSSLSTALHPFLGTLPKNYHSYELCSSITSKQIRSDACGWSHVAANSIFF